MSNYKFELDAYNHLQFKRITVAMLREVVFKNMIISGPGFVEQYMPSSAELQTLNEMALFAVNRGQVIDFGHWSNDFIKQSSMRVGHLYTEGALPMPFTTPWIFIHTWHDDKMDKIASEVTGYDISDRIQTSCYLIHPMPNKRNNHCVDFEACVLEGFNILGDDAIGVGDRVVFDGEKSSDTHEYNVQCIPMVWRFGEQFDQIPGMTKLYGWTDPQNAAVGNVCDPLMTALMLLNTRGIGQSTITAPDKLNKARLRRGKPAIPPYRKVDSAGYITALANTRIGARERSDTPGATRASPVMHVRIGHFRQYKSGQRTFIYDTLVKATPEAREAFRATRTHYSVKGTTENT